MATDYYYPIGFGPSANCKLGIPGCTLDISVFRYLPNVAANATFLAIFALLMVVHIAQGIRCKTWTYMGCIVAGCALELVGYVGRILLHDNPFDFNAFLINLGTHSLMGELETMFGAANVRQCQSLLLLSSFALRYTSSSQDCKYNIY